MSMHTRRLPLLVILVLLSTTEALAQSWPAPHWQVTSPKAEGLSTDELQVLVDAIREGKRYPRIHSLLIVRNGRLAVEEYFGDQKPEDVHMLQSVSKSITSALMGIAVDRGLLTIDEKVLQFFPGYSIQNLDNRKKSIKVVDLLTMRGGTDYHERGSNSPHSQLNRLSTGWAQFILNRPMVRPPGTHFQYDSGGVILMSSLIRARTGEHADSLAEEALLRPLGIVKSRWYKNSEGHPHMGGGLNLRPRDMARFGLLYLRQGQWGRAQVISSAWVHDSTRLQVEFKPPRGHRIGYGYLWWILEPGAQSRTGQQMYAALGFRGQHIMVVPEHDMVVVVTAGTLSYQDEVKPLEFLYTHILPAIEN